MTESNVTAAQPFTLDAEELDTILAIGRNEQSGRVTNYELKELVRVYQEALALRTPSDGVKVGPVTRDDAIAFP